MKNLLIIVIGVFVAGCATREMSTVAHKDAFSKFTDRYYEDYLRLDPLESTQIADNRYNDQLPIDISEGHRRAMRSFYERYRDSLRTFDRSDLTIQQQISYDILQRDTGLRLKLMEFPDHLMPVQQFWGMALTMPLIGSGKSFQPFKTAEDYDNFLRRMDAFAVWVDTAIVNMRRGLAQGYTYPRVLMERVLPQAKDMVVTDVTKSIFYQPITNLRDSIDANEKARLK